jgi:hypothetical protein
MQFSGREVWFHAIHPDLSDSGAERLWLRYRNWQIIIAEGENGRESNCQMERYERVFHNALWEKLTARDRHQNISRAEPSPREAYFLEWFYMYGVVTCSYTTSSLIKKEEARKRRRAKCRWWFYRLGRCMWVVKLMLGGSSYTRKGIYDCAHKPNSLEGQHTRPFEVHGQGSLLGSPTGKGGVHPG